MNQPPNWQQVQPPSPPAWPLHQASSQTPRPPAFSPPPKPLFPAWFRYALIIVICTIGGYAMGFSAGGARGGPAPTDTVATTQPANATTPQEQSTQAASWKTVQTFSGNGNKKTPIFSVSTNWRMNWTCHGFPDGIDGVFAVNVDNADGSFLDAAAVNARCKGPDPTSDTTNEHQGGSIYLGIIAAGGDWSIVVQDYQ